MSTEIAKSISYTYGQSIVTEYFQPTGNDAITLNYSVLGNNYALARGALHSGGRSDPANLKTAAKNALFPNSVAHPTKIEGVFTGSGSNRNCYADLLVDGTSLGTCNFPSGSRETHTISSSISAVTSCNSASTISVVLYKTSLSTAIGVYSGSFTFYFTRYDFSAAAGEGVTSASVSSSTGYDGDTVTFSCVVPTGYAFDGWYNGSTKVSGSQSYTHTVNGTDLTLTAKAHQDTHNVNGTYNGSTKAILNGVAGSVSVGYNGRSASLSPSSASLTLACAGKVMHGSVSVGSALLPTNEKLMRSNLVLNYV